MNFSEKLKKIWKQIAETIRDFKQDTRFNKSVAESNHNCRSITIFKTKGAEIFESRICVTPIKFKPI